MWHFSVMVAHSNVLVLSVKLVHSAGMLLSKTVIHLLGLVLYLNQGSLHYSGTL